MPSQKATLGSRGVLAHAFHLLAPSRVAGRVIADSGTGHAGCRGTTAPAWASSPLLGVQRRYLWGHLLTNDEGISGRKENRPQFQALIGNIHDQAIKCVVVYKWDRFARSTRIALESINRINTAGAAVVSVTEPIDDRTAAGRFNRDMMLSVAQLYSEMLAERMRLAFASKARSGKWVGSVPVGYVKRDGVIVPSDDAPTIRRVFTLYAEGTHSYSTIADTLNAEGRRTATGGLWQRESVRVVLRNPAYVGMVSSGGTPYQGTHEPLISRDLWDACQAIRERRSVDGSMHHPTTPALVNGLVYCAVCQQKLWHRTSGRNGDVRYYRCAGHERRTHPNAPMILADEIENQISDLIREISLSSGLIDDAIRMAHALLAARQTAPATGAAPDAIRERLKRLGLVYADGVIDLNTY
jgi:DNA invertase Pin-like site-specific DNA recombinase